MTLNELIKQLQDIVTKEPEAGNCHVYTPVDYDEAYLITKDDILFQINCGQVGGNSAYGIGSKKTFKEAKQYLTDGLSNGDFEEELDNHIILEIGTYE